MKINRRKNAALNYLRLGWSIVPVKRNKKPLVLWKEYQTRQPTRKEILEWLEKWPGLNWAVVTGSLSGIIVIDIDPRNGGEESFKELEKQYGHFSRTAKVLTGGGGLHLYFKHPGYKVPYGLLKPGVEVKGDNCLVTLPPSIHESGKRYRWEYEIREN